MIFVTVGTHEQQFDRLVSCIDNLKKTGIIQEDVMIQTGFSTYEPKYCRWDKLIPYSDMLHYMDQARIIITHGGPASFITPLQNGKIPVVIPRQSQFGEHVNDHQLLFCREVAARKNNIILVENIETLSQVLTDYEDIIRTMAVSINSNNLKFNEQFQELVNKMF